MSDQGTSTPAKSVHVSLLQKGGYMLDILMIALVLVNLGLIIFDSLFALTAFNSVMAAWSPYFHERYQSTIHSNFFYYDLWFVAIYLTEFSLRWLVAVIRKTYHRWFFYPFIHWYDLLGCIPVDGFRWLRLLRVVSLVFRLQRAGLINLSGTAAGQFTLKYYTVLIEEISDRVVLNVLEGVQREVRQGNPLVHRIEVEVLQPRKQLLVDYLANRIVSTLNKTHTHYRDDLGRYIAQLSDDALTGTRSGALLAATPVIGPRVIALLGETVRELGESLLSQVLEDISHPDNRQTIDAILLGLLEDAAPESGGISELLSDTLLDIIEQIKEEVSVQQWKLQEQQ